MGNLLFFALYFAPSAIAWHRARQGKPLMMPVGKLFLLNLFLGWTVVMWIAVLYMAVSTMPSPPPPSGLPYNPPIDSSRGQRPYNPPVDYSPPSQRTCSSCGGSGSVTCSTCGGRGSWYDAPQGESGVAQLRTCPACASSGRIRCMTCGGSGQVW